MGGYVKTPNKYKLTGFQHKQINPQLNLQWNVHPSLSLFFSVSHTFKHIGTHPDKPLYMFKYDIVQYVYTYTPAHARQPRLFLHIYFFQPFGPTYILKICYHTVKSSPPLYQSIYQSIYYYSTSLSCSSSLTSPWSPACGRVPCF